MISRFGLEDQQAPAHISFIVGDQRTAGHKSASFV
jgi:hypothetical protein